MPVALFLSPHLDDVIFSCGGLAALLAEAGWTTVLVTVFTRSVVPATGFALACQLDKGLSPDADYMAHRRAEDGEAAAILSFGEVRFLDLLEAPHRGYEAAPALFGPIHGQDTVGTDVLASFMALAGEFRPDLVLAPQGLGNHVDHQHVAAAAMQSFPLDRLAFYRDTPYAIRAPDASPLPAIPRGEPASVGIGAVLDRKIAAAQAYRSQAGFQFGGTASLARDLRNFAVQEGAGVAAERFCGAPLTELANNPIV